MNAAPFSLATIETPEGDRAAILIGDSVWRLDRLPGDPLPGSLRALLDDWPASFARLSELAPKLARLGSDSAAFMPLASAQFETPIKYPNKLVCVGAVYADHLVEMGLPPTRWAKLPIFFRPPTTSLVGPGRTVRIPPTTREFDWEIELAVVIGARLTDADEAEARAGIAGYCVGLDLSCRDLIDRHSPVGADLARSKAQNGMAPLGPVLTPAAFVRDPQSLSMKLWVNDELMQDGSTSTMLFPVVEQIATISGVVTLEPGDVVFTGSPGGSGAARGRFLAAGDRIRAQIRDGEIRDDQIGDRGRAGTAGARGEVGTLEVEVLPPRARRAAA